MANVDAPAPTANQRANLIKYFLAQIEAVAYLWQLGEYGYHDGALHAAVDELEGYRVKYGIDADTAQLWMSRAFAKVRTDLGGWDGVPR